MGPVGHVGSVNIGTPRQVRAKAGLTGIDKRPVAGPVLVSSPVPGQSGLAGDAICDTPNHGGTDQAVYAFAREDLDWWETTLVRSVSSGTFGENLTTVGVDVTGARLGERWKVGSDLVLAVTGPRIPCATFSVWMGQRGWLKAFTQRARPGAYLRVVSPGEVRVGDPVEVVHRPGHEVDIGLTFRALTRERELLPRLLEAGDDLAPQLAELARSGRGFDIDDDPADGPG
jgi:MOSC domain-containing protein YiiM